MGIKFLSMKEALSIARCKSTKRYKGVKDGIIPPPVKVGHSNRWLLSEIEEWQKACISGMDAPAMKAFISDMVAKRPSVSF